MTTKWLKLILAVFVLTAGAGAAKAQETRVTGHVSGMKPGTLVRVLVYADPFSQLEKTVASVRIPASGRFSFSISAGQTTYAMLAVNLQRKPFFLQPGAAVHFEIAPDSVKPGSVHFFGPPLQMRMKADDDSLNRLIAVYENMYSRLVKQHFREIYMYHNREVVQDFEQKVARRFQNVKAPYVKNYIRYALASLKWGARMASPPEIVQEYFSGRPVLYHNMQYARFFLDFFQAYFKSTVKRPVTIDKLQQIVPLRNLEKLDSLFARAPAMNTDARIRQLAEMVQLADCYYRPEFDREDVEALFRQMAGSSPFPENRKVARDYLVKLKVLQPGTPAPAFRLPDMTGKEVSLGDFKGKFVLLSFIHTGCPVCNFQLKQLAALQNHLAGFTNLSVVAGKVSAGFMQNARPADRNWPFLLLGNDILLLEKYQVITYPAYILVDPAGNISMAPAPMPGENLEQRIRNAINAFKKSVQN